ncbi:hypothetical protein EYC84_005854 [Monilinia fructicola]|uniref:Uncharacterized protein n=1 Tax=Monilinia fructicola TaxID=38448 RepID=A0A5M9K6F0_MONFR|nr:hypothetical protein EYC84_005854 [Monilinia fructicola]
MTTKSEPNVRIPPGYSAGRNPRIAWDHHKLVFDLLSTGGSMMMVTTVGISILHLAPNTKDTEERGGMQEMIGDKLRFLLTCPFPALNNHNTTPNAEKPIYRFYSTPTYLQLFS